MNLNQRAWKLCDELVEDAPRLRLQVSQLNNGTRLLDLGVEASGGIEAGLKLAEVCLAGLGRVSLVPSESGFPFGPSIQVVTDHPVAACMASQYAGWQIASGNYFAMGSGPMRAAYGREELFGRIGYAQPSHLAVGVLETSQLPPEEVADQLARQCGVEPHHLTLLAARTKSLAGNVQVVARSVETALHKLYELGFDLSRIGGGYGVAPLPPPAKNDLAAIGRTNDSILYGGRVTLYVQGDDQSLAEIGPQVPSRASRDFGEPFAAIFERAGRDFYRIDPHLFSPAEITLVNLSSGRAQRFGSVEPEIVRRSFAE